MSIFSIILGLIASGFAINGAGNLKEAWNKDYDSFKKSSFFSTKAKWGMNVAKKSTETAIPALIAVENFTGGIPRTAALQSVVDMVGGKLPKTGEQMSKTFSKVGEELSAPFHSSKNKAAEKESNKVTAPLIEKETMTTPETNNNQTNEIVHMTAENASSATNLETNENSELNQK